jgi:hypothetical protein
MDRINFCSWVEKSAEMVPLAALALAPARGRVIGRLQPQHSS